MWMLMILAAYVLGSIPFGLLIAKAFCGVDPRTEGSRNIGATNVARLCGMQWGVTAMLLDMAKGFLPALMADQLGAGPGLTACIALAALLGHVYSVFLRFRGGKAVATTLGIFAALAPWQCLGAAAICLAAIAVSGYVSLGSLALVVALPILLATTGAGGVDGVGGSGDYLLLSLAVAGLVFWRHRENIGRLLRGEEKSWRKGRESAADKQHTP
ncbi:glycerol-3-phosphate 1-O-acyltransferase PlsY [Megalodesulfovibrio paquesii]